MTRSEQIAPIEFESHVSREEIAEESGASMPIVAGPVTSADPETAAPHDPHLDPHLAHHFQSPMQQFEAAKLGMWLFLGTEFLLFGGLFCLYAVFRHLHPEIFSYGSKFLQVQWGMFNTCVLILSSLTMAWAVRCAQLNQRRGLIVLLALTILGGGVFMRVKYIEYSHKIHHNFVWGTTFYEMPADERSRLQAAAVPSRKPVELVGDPIKGQTLWMGTCRTCHGPNGAGIPGQGKDIRGSKFIAGLSDKELLAFVKKGRMPFDPLNTTGIQMPPRGGNPTLRDEDLLNIIAFVRTFKQPEAGTEAGAEAGIANLAKPAGEAAGQNSMTGQTSFVLDLTAFKSIVPDAPLGPRGMLANYDAKPMEHGPSAIPNPRTDPNRPQNIHLFFGMYFLMTGLHGLHVLIGMALIGWLLVRALLGHFTNGYFTPVDMVGLYWHVVDVIWIFLFPLFYLIH